jgi:multicomponent Na+:H+ antiporter subunit E
MKRWPVVGLVLAVLWIFVRGVALEPIRLVEELLIGLGVGALVAFVFRRFYNEQIGLAGAIGAVPAAVLYVVLFLWELLTANVDVAYRVLHPRMPIEPDVVELPLRVQSDLAITTIANSITLTPGTLTMDYDDHRNVIYVHAISSRDPAAVIAPIRRWEDYALRIFSEPLGPDDPVPDPGEDVRPADGAGASAAGDVSSPGDAHGPRGGDGGGD